MSNKLMSNNSIKNINEQIKDNNINLKNQNNVFIYRLLKRMSENRFKQ